VREKTGQVWELMLVKANRVLRQAQIELDSALGKKREVVTRQNKIDTMLVEYSDTLNGFYRELIIKQRQRTTVSLLFSFKTCDKEEAKIFK